MRVSTIGITLLVCACLFNSRARGQPLDADQPDYNENTTMVSSMQVKQSVTTFQSTIIVELDEPAGSKAVAAQQASFRDELRQKNVEYDERLVYAVAMNGISLSTDSANVDLIGGLANVKHIWLMASAQVTRLQSAGTANVNVNNTAPSRPFVHEMTGVDNLQKRGLTGSGVKVGVIDTGIDYMHPGLGGCFGPGCRVAIGWDFIGDNYNGSGSPLVPDNDPRDVCDGHGTHVAGIIGANDTTFLGVAPQVTFGAYRISGCDGALEGDVMIAAMERAYLDGMDIINLSINTVNSWEDNPRAAAAERLSLRGLIVVAAMGNYGSNGVWQASAPAIAPRALSVASVDSPYVMPRIFTLNVKSPAYIIYKTGSGKPIYNFTDTQLLVPSAKGENGCASTAALPDSHGQILLLPGGGCDVAHKAENAWKAGAAAVMLYGGDLASIPSTFDGQDTLPLPVIFVSGNDGQMLLQAMSSSASTPIRVNFDSGAYAVRQATGGQISSFSSWGPSPDLDIKPDVAAPGGNIYSTYPVPMGSYAVMSGTSMSTPYLVGAIALCLQSRGRNQGITVTSLRQAFQNAARPIADPKLPGRTISVARQGAGLINVEGALFGTTNVAPARITLNDTEFSGARDASGAILRNITIFNEGTRTRCYTVHHLPAMAVRGIGPDGVVPDEPEQQDTHAQISSTVTTEISIGAGQSARVGFRIVEPANLSADEYWIYSGYIMVRPVADNSTLDNDISIDTVHVPYMGVKGRMRDLHVLRVNDELPRLQTVKTGAIVRQASESVSYTIANDDYPILSFRLEYPCNNLQVRIYNDQNVLMGLMPGFPTEQVPRNDHSKDNSMLTSAWSGTFLPSNANGGGPSIASYLPNGRYYLKLMALRPFSDPTKDEEYDSWTSPSITINRISR